MIAASVNLRGFVIDLLVTRPLGRVHDRLCNGEVLFLLLCSQIRKVRVLEGLSGCYSIVGVVNQKFHYQVLGVFRNMRD